MRVYFSLGLSGILLDQAGGVVIYGDFQWIIMPIVRYFYQEPKCLVSVI